MIYTGNTNAFNTNALACKAISLSVCLHGFPLFLFSSFPLFLFSSFPLFLFSPSPLCLASYAPPAGATNLTYKQGQEQLDMASDSVELATITSQADMKTH